MPDTAASTVDVLAGTEVAEPRELDLAQLSRLLHLSAGVVRTSPRRYGDHLFRAAGSAAFDVLNMAERMGRGGDSDEELLAARAVRFFNPLTLTNGLCSTCPWAHVTLRQQCAADRLRRHAARPVGAV